MDTEEPDVLKQALRALTHQRLLELSYRLLDYPAARSVITQHLPISAQLLDQQPASPAKVQQLQADTDDFLENSRFMDGYDYEENEYDELDEILQAAALLHPRDQLTVLRYLLTQSNPVFENYPFGTGNLEEAVRQYGEAASRLALDEAQKRQQFEWLIGLLDWEVSGYGSFPPSVESALSAIASEPADYRTLIELLGKREHDYDAENWITTYYLRLGDDLNYLKRRQANLSSEAHHVELADYWLEHYDESRYLETLEDWIKKLQERKRDSTYRFSNYTDPEGVVSKLGDWYAEHHDDQNLQRILLVRAEYGRASLALYEQIKTVSKRLGSWSATQQQFLKLIKNNYQILAEVYLAEKDYPAAIKVAQTEHAGDSVIELVAEAVKTTHPQPAVMLYQAVAQRHIDRKSREAYKVAAEYAQKIKSIQLAIQKDEAAWGKYISGIRQEYHSYPALQDEFRKL